jgi:REP-associated tyrosine transposase
MRDTYPRGAHMVFEIHLHLVRVTKYWRAARSGDVGTRVRELIRAICAQEDVVIIKGHVAKDHVHLFVSIPPQVTISRLVQRLKGKSAVQAAARVSASAQEVLGPAHLGAWRVLLQDAAT